MPSQSVIFNGHLIPEKDAHLSIHDLALVRGYGIFDYFKTIHGKAVFMEESLDRFYKSASLMDLPLNFSKQDLISWIEKLMLANRIENSGIKILLTGGDSADGYSIGKPNLIISQNSFVRNLNLEEKGLKLLPFEYQRPFSQVKTIDYVMGIKALIEAKLQGADDVLYMHNSKISECPRANFFLINKEGVLLTASDHILLGVTRKKILELADLHGFKVELRAISLVDVQEAEEAFICSTTKNITPVTELVGYKKFGSTVGPITLQLQKHLRSLMYGE